MLLDTSLGRGCPLSAGKDTEAQGIQELAQEPTVSKSLQFKYNSTDPKAQVLLSMLGCLWGSWPVIPGQKPPNLSVSIKDSVFRLQCLLPRYVYSGKAMFSSSCCPSKDGRELERAHRQGHGMWKTGPRRDGGHDSVEGKRHLINKLWYENKEVEVWTRTSGKKIKLS